MTAPRSGAARVATILRVLPVALYMCFIWLASARTGDSLPGGFDDRLLHFGEYVLLALLMLFALTGFEAPLVSRGRLLAAAAICCSWAVLDEIHQSFVPGRDASLQDVGFDVLGTAAGLAFAGLVARRERDR